FLLECLPSRTLANTIQLVNLATYSPACLKTLRATTGIPYDPLTRRTLHFHTDEKAFAREAKATELMRGHGGEREVKTVDECVAIEPALAACREQLVGGVFTPTDESGDAQRFTQELARLAAARGVAFRWGTTVESLVTDGIAVRGARCRSEADREQRARESIHTEAYIVALGSGSPQL